MMCVPVDDMNECTDDVCGTDGTTMHNPKAVGTMCKTGGSQCDGNGKCVECLAATDCPGMDDACQTRTCTDGVCGKDFTAVGTAIPAQTAGDCKLVVCDGNGATTDNADDTDIPEDNNACTSDTCVAGTPMNTNLTQGTNCGMDGMGNPMVCDAMAQCVGCNVGADCPGADDECKTRTCTAGVCGISYTAKDTPVAAQTANNCLKHVCDGAGNFVDINDDTDVPLNDGNACTLETCAGGMPMHPNAMNGSMCSDGNACTQLDTCQNGSCLGASPVTCTAADPCHDIGVCDPATGMCSNPAKPNGSLCTDGNACTQSDTCQAGVCTGANPVTCTASDQCHDAGACNPATGVCSNPAKANGAACNDNNACTQSDTCQSGTCTGANPITCSASDQCHDPGVCNPASGTCSNPAKPNGSVCNDNNLCTQSDTCQSGTCTGASPVTCSASDQCHVAGTCDSATGTCSNPNAPDGTSCTLNGSTGICATGACTLCGNGTINAGEECDDGNTVGGDGCSATCRREESEPNNTCNVANTITLSGTPLSGSISGAITPIADQDWYSFTLPSGAPRSVRIETFIGGTGMCTAASASNDTQIFLYGANCTTQLGSDDDDGPDNCSLIDPTTDTFARNLSPGTYNVRTIRFNDGDVINNYQLVVTVVGTCGNNAVEPGEACDHGNLATGHGCNSTFAVESGYTVTGSTSLFRGPENNCNDGIDNNGNGAADSADASCAVPAYFAPCTAGQHLLVYPVSGPFNIPDTPAVFNSDINVPGGTQIAHAALLYNLPPRYD